MRLRILVPGLLALASLAPAAELAWSGAPGAKPPAGWSVAAAPGVTVEFLERAIEISAPPAKQALAVAAVGLPDGADDKPLRLSALVSASGKGALASYPALVALEWAGGAVFAVGLGDDPHSKKDERRAWALWSGNGKLGSDHAEAELAAGESPAHLRIVLTAREVAAYGSNDGWSWSRIAGVRREALGAAGAPARVVVGRGQTRQGAAGLAADPPADAKLPACRYRFAELRVEAGGPEVPAATLKSYVKKDSLSDTVDALAAAGMPRAWRIRGPEAARGVVMPLQLAAGFTAGEGWKDLQLGEGERFLQLAKALPGGGMQVRWAATTVATAEPGWLRFRFDGLRQCWLWVAGRLVSAPVREIAEAEADRQSASVWLPAGSHEVVLGVRSSDGRGAAILRHEPGDPRARIALLRRLAIDFAGDEQLIDAPFEMARLWEGLGFPREAAGALAELANADPDLAERALAERARLFHQLGDEAAATAETAALQQLWATLAADPVAAARRTARLWQRLDAPERALGILGEALKLPGLDGPTRCALVVDRARLRRALGDEPGVASELRAAAEHLPAGDAARFDLLVAAARLDPATPKPALDALAGQAVDALRARLLAGMHAARKDESSRLAARRLAAGLPATPLALPAVELAEDHAAAKDEAGALKLYQQELARRSLPAAADLAGARTALLRAVLGETAAGGTLLAAAGKLPAAAVQPSTWYARGPVPLGDWTPHEKPAFDPAKPPEGKEWRLVPADHWSGGILDHGRVGGGDNVVWYVATVIGSDSERIATASFGADDGLSVWLNGERLYSDRAQRGLVPDSVVLQLALRKGANVLLCAVQNGGGPSAFQCRLRREPWPASDVAGAVAAAGNGDRGGAAQTLADLANTLVGAERIEEAWALARAAIICFPERYDLIRDLAGRAISQPQVWRPSPAALLELVGWFDAVLADRRWDDAETRRWIKENVPGLLLGAGLLDEALARLRREALTELDPLLVAGAHLREADIWLGMGYPRAAAAAVQHARDAAPGEEAIDREADRRRRAIVARKGERIAFATPFELSALLRTAERALTGDPERAARDFQAVIENSPDQPVQLAGGRLRGAGMFAAASLRAAAAPVRQAWQEANGERAAAALARLAGDEPQAFAAVANRWPLAPAAGQALRREADLWAARGAWHLAGGTALRALTEHPGADPERLLLRAAHAAARLGDAAALDGLLARLAKTGKALPWDGRQLPPAELATALRALLPPVPAVEPERVALSVRLAQYAPAMRPETVADARSPLPAVASANGLLVVATPDDLAGVAADGTLRWQLPAGRNVGGSGPDLATGGEAALAVADGVAVAGVRRGGCRRLVAVDVVNGRQLWSSADSPELIRATVASAPTVADGRVWAWFIEASRGFVACLDARSGALLWRSNLGTGGVRQPFIRGGDVIAAGNAAAPALAGRELFVATDAGQVGAFDAVDGRLLWVHLYSRTAIDAEDSRTALRRLMARGRGRILVDADRVYLAPRDALGIIAIERAGGGPAWSAELADVHELCALAPAGLVALGPAVTLHNPATGGLRLRWRPASGERPGRPALVGGGLWIPLRYGPLRLDLAEGAIRQGPAWSALGLAEPATGLQLADGRLLALADGLVAAPVPGAAKPVTIAVALRPEPGGGTVAAAGDAAPSGLALRWELPFGPVAALQAVGDGEAYAVAVDRLHRLDPATGRIVWTAPVAETDLRGITVEGALVLVASESLMAVYDRASGRLRWSEPVNRDPQVFRQWWERWRSQTRLSGDLVLQWLVYDTRFTIRNAIDGRVRFTAVANGPIYGLLVAGEQLHLLVVRDKKALIEIRQLSDGRLVREVPLGIEGIERGTLAALPGGGAIVGTRSGGVLWDPAKAEGRRIELDMEWVHRVTRDGNLLVLGGQTDHRFRAAFIDPAAGRTLAQDEFVHHDQWPDRVRWAPRVIGGLRVQLANQKGQHGFLVRTLEGGEKAWVQLREEWRRQVYAMLPLGGKALGFGTDRDGLLRVQLLDPVAGKLEVDASFGLCMVPGVQPAAAAGGVMVPTIRGLVGMVPVAGPVPPLPGRALAETPQPVWRLPKPPVVDGRLNEWAEQAGWSQEAGEAGRGGARFDGPGESWVGWRDEGLAFAVRLPLSPAQVPITLVAVEAVRDHFQPEAAPLLLSLDWQGGRGQLRVLQRAVLEDATCPPLQARAASDGSTLAWEVVVPWGWLYAPGVRPQREHWLRWGAMAVLEQPSGAAVEFGRGLFPGLDKSGLVRLRLVDARPDADGKQPKPAPPKKK